MKRLPVSISISTVLLCSCSMPVYKGGIKPVYPEVGHGIRPPQVDSLTPTFRWASDFTEPCTYDFAIWDVGEQTPGVNRTTMEFRPYIYYKEGLTKPEHQIEIPLAPDTPYFWSVRIRSGNKISAWAKHDAYIWGGIVAAKSKNFPYRFKTPSASPVQTTNTPK